MNTNSVVWNVSDIFQSDKGTVKQPTEGAKTLLDNDGQTHAESSV